MAWTNWALGCFLTGQKLELAQGRAGCQGEEREEGTFLSLPSTCLLWLAMVTCKHLLLLHTAMLVLGSSRLPASTLRVETGDLQMLSHQEPSLVLQSAEGKWIDWLLIHPFLTFPSGLSGGSLAVEWAPSSPDPLCPKEAGRQQHQPGWPCLSLATRCAW